MKKHLLLLILIAVSLIVHFAYFGYPKETVFDEVHFGKFISGYFTREYFFDIHPPLGKLLLSGMGWLGGFRPGFGFAQIGEPFPDSTYLWLRLLPTLAGTLLPIILFFLARRLGLSKFGAFSLGMLAALDNALLVQSRFILLDSFLLLFGFSSLLAYFKYRQDGKTGFLFAAGILAILATSIKWTGASFPALIFIIEAVNIIRNRRKTAIWGPSVRLILALAIIPFAIYLSVFVVHLRLLYKSGPGDAFMSPAFQKTLDGNYNNSDANIQPIGLFGKFLELNQQMYKYNANLTATHPYSSKWYTWPFMTRPVYYWFHDNAGDADARIYLLGNPVVWWLAVIAIFYGVMIWIGKGILRLKKIELEEPFPIFIIFAFLLNLLPFVGVSRALFLYHYFPALIFAIMSLILILDRVKHSKKILTVIILVSTASFLFFAPLSYGRPLTEKAYNWRAWFSSWK